MIRSWMVLNAFVALTVCVGILRADASGEEWRQLFNGKDLDGWTMSGPGEFKIENGELVTYGGMGLLYYDKEPFGNCEIKVIFKLADPKDNSGVFIRVPDKPPTGPAGPMWAVNNGYEIQIDNNDNEYHRTGCLYSLTKAKAKVSPNVGEEATMIIRLEGPRTTVTVNGEVVTDYTEGDPVPEKAKGYEPNRGRRPDVGYIGLQNHGGHARVHFKEVSVRPLKKNP